MALLDGDEIVYVAQVPSKHSMRMFTEVGRRVLPHSTGVGKALLANTPDDEVRALLARTGMPAATEKTITTPDGFLAALEDVRRAGLRVDDNEQEIGVRCLAVSVPNSPTAAAISISGPAGRVTEAATEKIVPVLQQVARSCRRHWPARDRRPSLPARGAGDTLGTKPEGRETCSGARCPSRCRRTSTGPPRCRRTSTGPRESGRSEI